jgi:NAD(P)-dependent dehydrogenase (short-subunit alcohol dehydrogenase family)
MKLDLEGAICLISGGSRGMGLDLAQELVGEGAHVVIASPTEKNLKAAKEKIEAAGGPGKIEYAVADMSKQEGIDHAIATCKEKFGGPPLRVMANVVQVRLNAVVINRALTPFSRTGPIASILRLTSTS